MKKTLCFILTAFLLLTACIVSAGALTVIGKGYKNIAQGCSYTTTAPYTDRTYPNDYQLVDGKELTDGVRGTTLYGSEWVAFDRRMASPAIIIVDLGSVRNDIAKLSMEFRYGSTDSVSEPISLIYSVSDDGVNFTRLGVAAKNANGLNYNYDYVSETAFSGRYFKASVTHSAGLFVFASEFEVCIEAEVEIEVPENETTPFVFTGTSPIVRDGDSCIYGVRGNSTVSKFSENLVYGLKNVTAYDRNGKEKSADSLIATGDVLVKAYQTTELDRVTAVVLGDVNYDGRVDGTDYIMVKRHVLGTYNITGLAFAAGCIGGNGTIDASDYLKLKRNVLGTYDMYSIFDREAPQYESDMTFTMKSDSLYQMDCTYQGSPLKLTFDKKSWGTWNIGTFYYNNLALAGGGTDWEYVYRASSTNAGWVWSGGNHGNETLMSLDIFDSSNGTLKELSVGDSFTAKGVKIVEKTHLHWGSADNYYAEVTRTYYLSGNKITLDVDYHFVKDCYMFKSYTCMFPIFKTYGRNSRAYHIDGTTHENRTTDGTVYAEYGDHYDQGYSAQRVTFWGDSHSDWKFDVEIETPFDSTDNFSNSSKVMLWDMNRSADKLYFSKYDATVGTLVEAGFNVGTSSSWTFHIDAE